MSSLPARPRLADHVLPRRHVVDGEERVVLHDLATGRLVAVGAREWGLIAAADGTRDLQGIVLAAAREGAHARPAALEGFLAQLHAAGMLEDGAAPAVEPSASEDEPSPAEEEPSARPLVPLPGFSLHCDGHGSCCRFYGTVIFGPVEAARARALLPMVREGGARHERIFMPERGSGPTGGSAVTYCEGRCAYLGEDDRCLIHAAGGPEAKPVGCRTFPASFIDDGECVRVSVSVECACVLESAGRPGGSPLVPESLRVRGDLDPTLVVERLPDEVLVTASRTAPRAAFVAWSRLAASLFPAADAARSLFALGGAVESSGLDERACREAITDPPPLPFEEVRRFAEALARRASRRAREDEVWRSRRDLVLLAARGIAEAAALLADPEVGAALLSAPPPRPASEELYVAAMFHGHRLSGRRPVSEALRDRAVRLLVGRALGRVLDRVPVEERDPTFAHPLSLVEAALRGHGLDAYLDDVIT